MIRKPLHQLGTEAIERVESLFLIQYWFESRWWPAHYVYVIRRLPRPSRQRRTTPMVFHRLGDALKSADMLNGRFQTTNFHVRRIATCSQPYFEPGVFVRRQRDLRRSKRAKLRHRAKVLCGMADLADQRHDHERAIKVAEKDYERDPIKYEFYSVEDYDLEPVAKLLNPRKKRKRKHGVSTNLR